MQGKRSRSGDEVGGEEKGWRRKENMVIFLLLGFGLDIAHLYCSH